jgi:glycerol-3-phosphate O-acyltransferase
MAETDETRSFFFLGRPEGTLGRKTQRRQSQRMLRLIDHQDSLTDRSICIVPVSIFWGHQPDREKSVFKLLLSENWSATSRVKKFFAMLFHRNHMLVQFGKPVRLDQLINTEAERERQARKLMRLVRVHFNRERQAIIGPDLSHRRTLINTILHAPAVRAAIEREVRTSETSLHRVEKKALGYAREIVSDVSYRVIRFFDVLLTWLWNNLYDGIAVNGVDRLKDLAQSHEIVYTPCHRSHIDYLLLSFVLYHNGLTPPHIAAGRNLNLPIIGGLLRRAGAFYMRRSFKGDSLYKEIFDEYLHQMFTKGYSVEYFIEGGRSRTGRTLPPRTGMLSMTLRSFQKDATKPIAFLPVYFGYERVLESSTYSAELSGKETLQRPMSHWREFLPGTSTLLSR